MVLLRGVAGLHAAASMEPGQHTQESYAFHRQ